MCVRTVPPRTGTGFESFRQSIVQRYHSGSITSRTVDQNGRRRYTVPISRGPERRVSVQESPATDLSWEAGEWPRFDGVVRSESLETHLLFPSGVASNVSIHRSGRHPNHRPRSTARGWSSWVRATNGAPSQSSSDRRMGREASASTTRGRSRPAPSVSRTVTGPGRRSYTTARNRRRETTTACSGTSVKTCPKRRERRSSPAGATTLSARCSITVSPGYREAASFLPEVSGCWMIASTRPKGASLSGQQSTHSSK